LSEQVIVVVTQPAAVVHHILCDRTRDLAPWLSGIDAIDLQSRETMADGSVRCVQSWRARANVGPLLAAHIDAAFLEWLAHTEWRPGELESRWTIEPRFLKTSARCEAKMSCAPAMGGRGTRVSIAFEFVELDRWAGGVLTLTRAILATHLRKLVEAAARLAESEAPGTPGPSNAPAA
jgi:hypothetical protein